MQLSVFIKASQHKKGLDYWVNEFVLCGKHNHLLPPYVEGHTQHARLTPLEKDTFIYLNKEGVKMKIMLAILKDKNLVNSLSLQTMYNVKKKIIKQEREGRT